jgi:predicted amidohydrolase
MSRLATLQPARHLPIITRLADEDSATEQDYQDRLRPDFEQYDPQLQRRVLELYVDHLCELLHRVGQAGCDLVLLPECCLPLGGPYLSGRDNLAAACEPGEALWLEKTAPIARQYQMLIASCYYRKEGDKLYNDGVLMDERGEIAGIYHKVHLPCPLDWEVNEACLFVAGNDYPVFETRVGKIGFQICYDIDFPEGCRCLALNGADIILHPTVGYAFPDEEELMGEARLRTRASDSSVTVLYSNFGPSVGRSAIYANNGNQIACCGRGADVFVMADLDARAPRMQDWGVGLHNHRDQLARKRRPDTYGPLTQSCPPMLAGCERPAGRLYEYPAEVGLE